MLFSLLIFHHPLNYIYLIIHPEKIKFNLTKKLRSFDQIKKKSLVKKSKKESFFFTLSAAWSIIERKIK